MLLSSKNFKLRKKKIAESMKKTSTISLISITGMLELSWSSIEP